MIRSAEKPSNQAHKGHQGDEILICLLRLVPFVLLGPCGRNPLFNGTIITDPRRQGKNDPLLHRKVWGGGAKCSGLCSKCLSVSPPGVPVAAAHSLPKVPGETCHFARCAARQFLVQCPGTMEDGPCKGEGGASPGGGQNLACRVTPLGIQCRRTVSRGRAALCPYRCDFQSPLMPMRVTPPTSLLGGVVVSRRRILSPRVQRRRRSVSL